MSLLFATNLQTTYRNVWWRWCYQYSSQRWLGAGKYMMMVFNRHIIYYQIVIILVLTVYHCFLGTGGKCGFRPKLERHVYCHVSYTDGFRVYFSKRLVADTCWRARNHRQHNIIWRFSQPKAGGRKLQWNMDIG